MAKHKKGGKAAAQPPDVQRPQLKKEGATKAKPTKALQQGKVSGQGAAAAAAPPQAAAAAAAAASDIDELFGKLKGKKKAAAAKEEPAAAPAVAAAKEGGTEKTKRVEGSKDDIFGTEAALARKRTEEGYAIYSEAELGLGRSGGGGTDLCPFDCDCCF